MSEQQETKVFKVQRPLLQVGHKSAALWLAYPEDRSVMHEFTPDNRVIRFMGGSLRMYCNGYIDRKGRLFITERIPDQSW